MLRGDVGEQRWRWGSCSQLIKSSARSWTVSRLQIFRPKLIHLSEKFSNCCMEASSWRMQNVVNLTQKAQKISFTETLCWTWSELHHSKSWMDLSYKISNKLKSYLWCCSVSLSLFDSWICHEKKMKKRMTWWCEWKFAIYFFPWFGLVLEYAHCIHRQLFSAASAAVETERGKNLGQQEVRLITFSRSHFNSFHESTSIMLSTSDEHAEDGWNNSMLPLVQSVEIPIRDGDSTLNTAMNRKRASEN